MCAQASHASIAFLTNSFRENGRATSGDDFVEGWLPSAAIEWINGPFVKICVRVDSLEELMTVYEQAKAAGLMAHLITDAGRTEFKEPTVTCCGIGPDYPEKLDPVTGELRLL